ncbi:APA family fibronectin-binding glycoprotein [Mycolicibacterium sp. BiH015]|uniref:APA family fibronectin-binding glycoprotein n=1 Tax=Mycolicibacterium sp. BiH015 TaxID=3018808 RepID=UPI0022E16DE9|nr:APA family fibronectin-binding glycoprotein [Mycolicibacterium sp. BiH015]MDA2892581.1 APA family fibronectin-binding glycoprotein [Mycolicibacterium sp. BiH015]
MPLRIGEAFAGYRIQRLLGSGGMGEVYLVQHPRLPRQEALKVLRPDLSSDVSFRERFIREADLAAGLRHPHIVGVHDRGEHEGHLWIAMDYIDGTDAARLLGRKYPAGMPIDLVIHIATGVASALDYAHKKGLLHRDVKPANIIVADLDSEDPNVYLADFGIARPLDDTSGITTTNMTVGTVAYAAPEQLMGETMDGRADQYALAATSYNLLTGNQLFPHSNPAVVISRHLNTPPPKLGTSNPSLAGLDHVFEVALTKSPNGRYPSCTAFVRALADIAVEGSEFAATQAAPRAQTFEPAAAFVPPPTARVGKLKVIKSWPVVAVAATAVLIAILVLLFARSYKPWQAPQANSEAAATAASTTTSAKFSGTPAPSVVATSAATSQSRAPEAVGENPINRVFVPPVAPRIMDLERAFSFVVPRGWDQNDASQLQYGSARLSPAVGPSDAESLTQITLGVLDGRLFAGAETNTTTAAQRLASDMGEFYLPFPGERVNQQVVPLKAGEMSGVASYYEVKFTDRALPDGQIWAAVIAGKTSRYFVIWLGQPDFPVDMEAAMALAESIRET